MIDGKMFDRDYFERGLETGKSTYQNYRWIPELTIPLAYEIIYICGMERCQTILDFGCAKGFIVKALRLLHFNAYGLDISSYAIDNAPGDIKPYLTLWDGSTPLRSIYRGYPAPFNWIIAKDVFEHISYDEIESILQFLYNDCDAIFAIIPLGKDGKFNAELNNLDITHKICETYEWWKDTFKKTGWVIKWSSTRVSHIKQTYFNINDAHGFFKLIKK